MGPTGSGYWVMIPGVAAVGCSDDTREPEARVEAPAEVDLAEPGPDGWQFETGSFDVPAGEEVQDCYFYEVPFDEPTFVKRIHCKAFVYYYPRGETDINCF